MEGINGKKRFTLLFPGLSNQTISFGDCDPKSEDRADVAIRNGEPYLMLFGKDGYYDVTRLMALPLDTMICNGWYPEERDEFVPIKDFQYK